MELQNGDVLSTIRRFFANFETERVLLTLLLTVSVGLNLFFSYELVHSRERVDLLLANRQLTIGETAPILSAHDEHGREISVDFSGRQLPTILYLQSTSCHWCEQNSANLRDLEFQAPGKYQVVNLFFEKPTSRVLSNSSVVYLFEPSTESRITFNLNSTPTTILFSPDGKVLKIWKGAYSVERRIDIERVLGVRLSGLVDNVIGLESSKN